MATAVTETSFITTVATSSQKTILIKESQSSPGKFDKEFQILSFLAMIYWEYVLHSINDFKGIEVVKKYLDGYDDEKTFVVAILISISGIIVCALVIMFMLMAITGIAQMYGDD